MKSFPDITIRTILVTAATFLCWPLLFNSCVTIPKAEKKLDASPVESARYCSLRFPTKDSIITRDSIRFDTTYVSGDTVYVLHHDSLNVFVIDTIKITLPSKIITKTILHDTTIFRDNTATVARIKYLEGITAVKDSDISRLTRGRNTYRIVTFAEGLLILLIIGGLIYANTHRKL